jgi:hypothetical protein
MAVREEYEVLRAGLRSRPDETFVDDRLVQDLTGLVNELAPLRATYQALEDTVRPIIVRGYEVALWWAYLQTNGMLKAVTGEDYKTYDYDDDIEAGTILEGYVIKKVPPRVVFPERGSDPGLPQEYYLYEADHYFGVPRLGEECAEYLYETFAKPYFALDEHVKELPFEYDPSKYVGVRAQEKRVYGGLLPNKERARRIDEMRLMVILFFRKLPTLADPTSTGMIAALGELRGSPPSVAGWLALHPEGTAPLPPNPLDDGSAARTARTAAPALAALLADSGVLNRTLYDTQLARLDGAVATLQNDIFEMQAIATGVLMPETSTRGIDVEEYAPIVKAEQEQLPEIYARALALAEFDHDETERLRKSYEALVYRLATWTLTPTETVQRTPWRFETPTPTP